MLRRSTNMEHKKKNLRVQRYSKNIILSIERKRGNKWRKFPIQEFPTIAMFREIKTRWKLGNKKLLLKGIDSLLPGCSLLSRLFLCIRSDLIFCGTNQLGSNIQLTNLFSLQRVPDKHAAAVPTRHCERKATISRRDTKWRESHLIVTKRKLPRRGAAS